MKKIFPFYLYPNFFKLIGIIAGVVGITLSHFLNIDYQLVFFFGLILIVFTKEKKETELIEKIRAETFKTISGYFLALLFVIYLMGVINTDISFPSSPFLFIGFPMILYLLYFNLLLIRNQSKDDEDRKSKRLGYVSWLAFALISGSIFGLKLLT